jgi:hypothetical protein
MMASQSINFATWRPPITVPKDIFVGGIADRLIRAYREGKVPLLVLGAGISANLVPLLHQMAEWILRGLQDNISHQLPESLRTRLIEQGTQLQSRSASRREAAEFFSALQILDEELGVRKLWADFCRSLAFGLQLPNKTFPALFTSDQTADGPSNPRPSKAHIDIARLLTVGGCQVLNLNFDPLLYLAMEQVRKGTDSRSPQYHFIALHSREEILTYFASPDKVFQPSVVNARGDVFFQRCTNVRCPQSASDHALEAHRPLRDRDDLFTCPVCHLSTFRLQISFPGYETKERLLQPIVETLYALTAPSVSMIITIGLSGQWDPYLLTLLFKWSLAQSIPLIDINIDPSALNFEHFRSRLFPDMPTEPKGAGPYYLKVVTDADTFAQSLLEHIRGVFPEYVTSLPSPLQMDLL